MRSTTTLLCLVALVVAFAAPAAFAEEGTRLLMHPNYHDGALVFNYRGDLWIQRDGEKAQILTVHDAVDTRPVFSPDGKWIAFASDRSGNWDVFVVPAEGGRPRQLTFHSGTDIPKTWTPDGRVVFSSRRDQLWGGGLFTVGMDGKLPEAFLVQRSSDASISEDGQKAAYTSKSSRYDRKNYEGSSNTKIFVFDLEKQTAQKLLPGDKHQNSPMYVKDEIYFATEKEGAFNLYKVTPGGKPEQLTTHGGRGISNPSISPDRSTIVYEFEYGIWKFDVKTGKTDQVPVEIKSDYRENPVRFENFSKCDSFSVSPDGEKVVLSTHGEIFVVPADKGAKVQITDSPARDQNPEFSPDGKLIAFVSDRSGSEEAYVVSADGSNLLQVTNAKLLVESLAWSPDSKKLALTLSDNSLRVYELESRKLFVVIRPETGSPYRTLWSPDGKWLACAIANRDHSLDTHVVAAEENASVVKCVVKDLPYSDWPVAFTKDKIYLMARVSDEREGALYEVALAKQLVDPDDPDAKKPEKKKPEKKDPSDDAPEKKDDSEKNGEKKSDQIPVDLDGIQDRLEKLLQVDDRLAGAVVSDDGKHIVVLIRDAVGGDDSRTMYRFNPKADRNKLSKIGSADRVSGLRFAGKGKLYYLSGGRIFSRSASPGSPKIINFSVPVKIDAALQREQVFHEVWRTMKHQFYDENMHGVDWNAMREHYAALLPSVADKHALSTVLNRMLGELNASHMGYSPARDEGGPSVDTKHPGFEMEVDPEKGLYRVTVVYDRGPASEEWVDLQTGDYVLKIDGRPIKAGDNYYRVFNRLLNDRVVFTVSAAGDETDARETKIKMASSREVMSMRYYDWIEDNRRRVAGLSGGRLAYIHIPSMSGRWLANFKRELHQYRLADGVVIDIRFNGGGNIDTYLLDVLEGRYYGYFLGRNSVPSLRPYYGFFGVKCCLINESSASNSEMFPWEFRELGLGKVIGRPTPGAVIGTGGHRLMDGSYVRVPRSGVYTSTDLNLENWGVKPDIELDVLPEDEIDGKDPQLEKAVEVLVKELETAKLPDPKPDKK